MTTRSVAKRPRKTRKEWAAECRGWQRKTVEGMIGLGKTLTKAKHDLDHGEWLPFLRDDLKINARVAQKLMQLARNPRISNTTNSSYLPSSFSALVALGRLSDEDFATGIKSGAINPGTTAKQATEQHFTITVEPARPARLETPVITVEPVTHVNAQEQMKSAIRRGLSPPPRPALVYRSPDPLIADLAAIEEQLCERLEGDRLERALAGLEQIRKALAEPTGEVVPFPPS
jgi:hypothetical protein